MMIRLTTDFSSATMDTRRLENHIFQVFWEITFHQESYTPLNWSEIKNWDTRSGLEAGSVVRR